MTEELVDYVAQNLVDHPESVQTRSESTEDGLHIVLSVKDDDRGQVIGHGGQTARALRSIVRAAGAIHDRAYTLDIADE
ncbi:MAG: KH domain-containing protein [bacterium]